MPKLNEAQTAQAAYVTDTTLARHFGVNRATIWAWVNRNGFPAPVKLSPQMTRWTWADVHAWEAAQARAG
ncbi:AlpA family transcriptional regulator [Gemmobacter aquarius]|uniref:AlpA family transcriptional regulator n=1 Tax=Paragemmobacter aquarius TaxID=2169400 RepID=A0A2S0UK76_9RHOB|nr:AlpA family phage regulatory protein [Gemmobacter aquarius]AWB48224.1 AlpA family transcriptional regulator [Gemmobacter aquarius]